MEANKWELKISAQFGNRTHIKENGKQIFVIEHYCDSDTEKREIENRITKAVNSHEELLRALHNCVVTLDAISDTYNIGIGEITINEAKEILQKVKDNT